MTFLACLVFYMFDDIYGGHEQSMVGDTEDAQVLKQTMLFRDSLCLHQPISCPQQKQDERVGAVFLVLIRN